MAPSDGGSSPGALPLCHVPLTRRRADEADVQAGAEVRCLHEDSAFAASRRDYSDARRLHTLMEQRRARAKRERTEQEHGRQMRERAKLEEAHQSRMGKHESRAVEDACAAQSLWARKIDALRERHREDLARFERDLRARDDLDRAKPPIHSTHVRDMQQTELRLAEHACFEEAQLVRMKIEGLERRELAAMDAAREERLQRKIQRLREKQQQEERFLQTQAKNALSVQTRKAAEEHQRMRRNLANLAQDMRHAHRVELTAAPGVGQYVHPHFIKLRPRKQAPTTCLGTAALEKEKGSRLANVPSLCSRYSSLLGCARGVSNVDLAAAAEESSAARLPPPPSSRPGSATQITAVTAEIE